jgi:IS1 family transposase
MKTLTAESRSKVIRCLVEGNSIRATVRMTGVAKNTVVKLLADVGQACLEYQDKALRNLPCKRIQCDEIWSFCYAKEKNLPKELRGKFGYGDVWTWTALCADTKIVPCWLIGGRSARYAKHFISDLASRLANRVQLTTDGHRVYLDAVEQAFGSEIDYAMLVKLYGSDRTESEARYSPAECIGAMSTPIIGKPDSRHISTSFVKRQNLTMRMQMRRFTRLTNGFSKKLENHQHAVALYFMYYNFCRIHQTLCVTPAMEAKVSDHVWGIEEIVALVPIPKLGPRGPYKKKHRNSD